MKTQEEIILEKMAEIEAAYDKLDAKVDKILNIINEAEKKRKHEEYMAKRKWRK